MDERESIGKAVNEAIKENLLDGFFGRQKAEVIKMILTEFDEELFKQNVREDGYEEGWADGRKDGLADGQKLKASEDAMNLLKANISPEIIARCIGLSLEKVKELAKNIQEGNISPSIP